uniref:Secreted protein n=1 Tax=Triticum urartu TaxID=4572 RepID=A0A8R7U994_TRIUA
MARRRGLWRCWALGLMCRGGGRRCVAVMLAEVGIGEDGDGGGRDGEEGSMVLVGRVAERVHERFRGHTASAGATTPDRFQSCRRLASPEMIG